MKIEKYGENDKYLINSFYSLYFSFSFTVRTFNMSSGKTINIDNFTFDSEIKQEPIQVSIKLESDSIDDIPSSSDPSLNKSVKTEVKISPECDSCGKTFSSNSSLKVTNR